jgi:hypothetical protein
MMLPRESAMVGLAVELYQWHSQDVWGRCACGAVKCPVKVRAAGVLRAAGLDPERFDAPSAVNEPTQFLPVVLPRRVRGASLAAELQASNVNWWRS